jgi:hypothetical protein
MKLIESLVLVVPSDETRDRFGEWLKLHGFDLSKLIERFAFCRYLIGETSHLLQQKVADENWRRVLNSQTELIESVAFRAGLACLPDEILDHFLEQLIDDLDFHELCQMKSIESLVLVVPSDETRDRFVDWLKLQEFCPSRMIEYLVFLFVEIRDHFVA